MKNSNNNTPNLYDNTESNDGINKNSIDTLMNKNTVDFLNTVEFNTALNLQESTQCLKKNYKK